jgi:invasion protein IalB
VKLCEKANAVTNDKEGKEEKKEVNVCLTHHQHLDEKGNVLVSAALRQVEGQDKQHFMVMVPLGKLIKPGMRATIYPKDLWESVETNQGISDSNQEGYSRCRYSTRCAIPRAVPQRWKRRPNSSRA